MARLSVATTPDSGVQRTNIIFHHYTFLWEVPWDDIVEGPQREKNREKQNHSPASWPSSGNKHFFLCCFSWKHLITNHLNISHHKKYGGRTFNILVHITCIGTWTDLGWQLVTGTSLTDQNWLVFVTETSLWGQNLVLKATHNMWNGNTIFLQHITCLSNVLCSYVG